MEWSGAETISWHPEEMHFTVICGGNPAALGQTSDADPFFSLSSLFTQGDTDVRGQSDQADALILTWGKSYSYSCRWTDAILRESTGGGRIWVSVSSRGEGESGLMRRDVSVLPSPPPQSHIKGLRGVMNPHLTFFQYTHYFMCAWAHTHTRRNILYSFRVHIQRPDFCFTVLLMYE